MEIRKENSLAECATIICTAFHKLGTTIVLTGGSAATYYAPQSYQSRDIDFVLQVQMAGKPEAQALRDLGYESGPGSCYRHPLNPFTIEFINDDLMIGEELISSWNTVTRDNLTLHVLHPIDCIKDRLTKYIYWHDNSAMEAAAGVYNETDIDIDIIKEWCQRESPQNAEQTISRLLALANRTKPTSNP
ncbi:MAG: hypothetical protein ACKVQS_02315 [Fimbriimonadaceae bacterium]